MEWITSRQPLASDGNRDGAVHVRKYPDREWGVNIHWSYVGTGVPWQHTNDFEGRVEPISETQDQSQVEDQVNFDTGDSPWRVFLSINRTYYGSSFVLDALATDGTAWYFVQNPAEDGIWRRIPDLPQS